MAVNRIYYQGNSGFTRMYQGSELVWEAEEYEGLRFTALSAGTIALYNNSLNEPDIYYSTDNGIHWTEWATESYSAITVESGNSVCFKGTYISSSNTRYSYFKPTGNFKVSGNVMSLLDDGECTGTTVPDYGLCRLFYTANSITDISELELPATDLGDHAYFMMFYNNTGITDASGLVLQAETASTYSYASMFSNCTSMVLPPVICATTVDSNACKSMFMNCIALTTMPVLPATTLGELCYYQMFYSCEKLVSVEDLPATTLATSCYSDMFTYCSRLTTAPALPATTLATNCYTNMFRYCTRLATAPALPATTLAEYCYASMFYECTSLTEAPVLPASELVAYCYSSMFGKCSKLNKVEIYADSTTSSFATSSWLNKVASAGTFYNYGDLTYSSGGSGIPSGWTIVFNGMALTALEDNSAIAFNNYGSNAPSLKYSVNGSAWTTWDYSEIDIESGDTVYFKGEGIGTSLSSYSTFALSGNIKASGNIMCLVDNGAGTATTVPDYAFAYLFAGQAALTDASELTLPATTLGIWCYLGMFNGSSITIAPVLPATTLVTGCYSSLFMECASINTIYCYAEDISATSCLSGWLKYANEEGRFYNYGGAAFTTGTSGIPSGWTEITE